MSTSLEEARPRELEAWFDEAIVSHREGGRFLLIYGVILLLAGFLAMVTALTWASGSVPMAGLGILTMALALVPLKGWLERKERVEGLMVLRSEWADLQVDAPVRQRSRFLSLLSDLYDGAPAGADA